MAIKKTKRGYKADVRLGRADRVRETFPTHELAVKWEKKIKGEWASGTYFPKSKAAEDRSWSLFCDEYYNDYAMKEMISPHRGELSRMRMVKEYWADKSLGDVMPTTPPTDRRRLISPEDIKEYLQSCRIRGCNEKTINRYLSSIQSMFKFAIYRGYITRNPVANVERRKNPKGRLRFLDLDEIDHLKKSASTKRMLWFIEIGLLTGFRPGNIQDIDIKRDVDFRTGVVWARGKGGFEYNVKMAPRLIEIFAEIRKEKSEGKALGYTENKFRMDWADTMDKANLDNVQPYTLRHTFASHLLMSGVDIKTVAELMGHTSTRMVDMIYGHISAAHKEQAVSKLPWAGGKQIVSGDTERGKIGGHIVDTAGKND